jgi:uncharacterized protein
MRIADSERMTYAVLNATRNTSLGDRIVLAGSSRERRAGLLKRDFLEEGSGLWIAPCEGVHTMFMKFPIDVLYLDRAQRVRKIRRNLRPWRLSACLVARSVLELPAGTADRSSTTVGDQLTLEPRKAN